MNQEVDPGAIMAKLARLQEDMDYVRGHLEDTTLTLDDLEILDEAETEYREGRTTPREALKAEFRV